jgi:hypothetical protein
VGLLVGVGEGELAVELAVGLAVVACWDGVGVAVAVEVGQGGVVDPLGELLVVGGVQQAQVVDAGLGWGSVSGWSARALGWAWRPIRNATAVPNERCW